MTLWQQHKQRWSNCTACGLCKTRSHVVLLRGSIPAQVLFIGEAPGQSEDVLGRPFIGPAGQLLDKIISAALSEYENPPTYALTNLVACIPIGEEGTKTAAPPVESIHECTPRLREIVTIVDPKLIICVGSLAESWTPSILQDYQIKQASIIHPAAILRMNPVQQPLSIKRAVIGISDAVREAFELR